MAARSDLLKAIGVPQTSKLDLLASIELPQDTPPQPLLSRDQISKYMESAGIGERKHPKGFLGPLGTMVWTIDKPAAVLRSTMKEIGDVVMKGELPSPMDWKRQIDDNMLWGEILQDWGVDLPGPFDFVAGLALDIATDPLTYMFGIGAYARIGRAGLTWERSARLMGAVRGEKLRKAMSYGAQGRNAEAAVLTREAADLLESINKTVTRRAISGASAQSLQAIGLDSRLGFFVPGTGRLGRWLGADELLDSMSKGWVTRSRLQQAAKIPWLDEVAEGAARARPGQRRVVDDLLNLSDDVNLDPRYFSEAQIAERINDLRLGRLWKHPTQPHPVFKGAPKGGLPTAESDMLTRAARAARVMPAEAVRLPEWTGKIVRTVGPAAGGLAKNTWRNSRGIQTVDEAFNTNSPIRALLNSDDPYVNLYGIELMGANTDGWRAKSKLMGHFAGQVRKQQALGRELGLDPSELRDFFSHEIRQVDINTGQPRGLADGLDPRILAHPKWGPRLLDEATGEALTQLWERHRLWWDEIELWANRYPGAEGDWLRKLTDDLYVARFSHPQYENPRIGSLTVPGRSGPSPTKTRIYRPGLGDVDFRGVRLLDPKDHPQGLPIHEQIRDILKVQLGDDAQELWEDDIWKVMDRYMHVVGDEVSRQARMESLHRRGVAIRKPEAWYAGERKIVGQEVAAAHQQRERILGGGSEGLMRDIQEADAINPDDAAALMSETMRVLGASDDEIELAMTTVFLEFNEAGMVSLFGQLLEEGANIKALARAGLDTNKAVKKFFEPWVREVYTLHQRRVQVTTALQETQLRMAGRAITETELDILGELAERLAAIDEHLYAMIHEAKQIGDYTESVTAANEIWRALNKQIGETVDPLLITPELRPWLDNVRDLRQLMDDVDYKALKPLDYENIPRFMSNAQADQQKLQGYFKRLVARQAIDFRRMGQLTTGEAQAQLRRLRPGTVSYRETMHVPPQAQLSLLQGERWAGSVHDVVRDGDVIGNVVREIEDGVDVFRAYAPETYAGGRQIGDATRIGDGYVSFEDAARAVLDVEVNLPRASGLEDVAMMRGGSPIDLTRVLDEGGSPFRPYSPPRQGPSGGGQPGAPRRPRPELEGQGDLFDQPVADVVGLDAVPGTGAVDELTEIPVQKSLLAAALEAQAAEKAARAARGVERAAETARAGKVAPTPRAAAAEAVGEAAEAAPVLRKGVPGKGECWQCAYRDANKMLQGMREAGLSAEEAAARVELVHGNIPKQLEGPHAWVEYERGFAREMYVLDDTVGLNVPRDEYYAATGAEPVHRFRPFLDDADDADWIFDLNLFGGPIRVDDLEQIKGYVRPRAAAAEAVEEAVEAAKEIADATAPVRQIAAETVQAPIRLGPHPSAGSGLPGSRWRAFRDGIVDFENRAVEPIHMRELLDSGTLRATEEFVFEFRPRDMDDVHNLVEFIGEDLGLKTRAAEIATEGEKHLARGAVEAAEAGLPKAPGTRPWTRGKRPATLAKEAEKAAARAAREAEKAAQPPKWPIGPNGEEVDRFIIGTPYGDFLIGRHGGQEHMRIMDIPYGVSRQEDLVVYTRRAKKYEAARKAQAKRVKEGKPKGRLPARAELLAPEGPRGRRLLGMTVRSVDDARERIGVWVQMKVSEEAVPMARLRTVDNPRLRRVLEELSGYRRDLTPVPEGSAVGRAAELEHEVIELALSRHVEAEELLGEASAMYRNYFDDLEKGLDLDAQVALLEARQKQLYAESIKRNGALYQDYLQDFNTARGIKGFPPIEVLQRALADGVGAQFGPKGGPNAMFQAAQEAGFDVSEPGSTFAWSKMAPRLPLWAEGWDIAGAPEAQKATWDALFGLHKSSLSSDPFMPEFFKFYDRFLNYWKAQAVTSSGFILRNLMGGSWINMAIAGQDPRTFSKFGAMLWASYHRGAGDLAKGAEGLLQEALEAAPRFRRSGRELPRTMRMPMVPQQPWAKKLRVKLGLPENADFGYRTVSVEDLAIFADIIRQRGVVSGGQAIEPGGFFSGGQVITEVERGVARRGVRQVRNPITDEMVDVVYNPATAEFAPFRAVRTGNEIAEIMLRGSLAFDILKKGGTATEALSSIYKFHFNYADLARGERYAKRFIPFWKWQKSVLPVLVESVGRNTNQWGRLYQIKGEMELTSDEENVVPDYFLENMGVRLPWKTNGYQVYAVPDLPFRDLNRLLKEPTSITRMFAESAAPPVKTFLEMWAGKQFFADIPFSGRYQQVPHVYAKVPFLMHAMQLLGKADKNSRGEWRMRDNDLYLMDSFMPFMARLRRMFPNEEKYQRRIVGTVVSTVFGTAIRVNDQFEQRNQQIRNDREFDEKWRDILDLEWRTR